MGKQHVDVSVGMVGPCLEDYGSLGMGDRRHLAVEVTFKGQGLLAAETSYYLEAREWTGGAPVIYTGVSNYGRSLDLERAEVAVATLKALRAYVRRLPVPPRSLADNVATILAHHQYRDLDPISLLAYQDHRTRPHISETVSRARLLHLVEQAEAGLAGAAA